MQALRQLAAGFKEPADTHSPPWPLGSPHAQQSCIPKATALSPGEACASQALLRENGGAGSSHAGLCRLTLLLAPCSSPRQYPQCPVPGSPSVGAGLIASTSAAAWGTAPRKVPLGLGGCISPCFKPRCQGRGMCAGAQPRQSTSVVWRTSKKLRGQAGSFWGPGNQQKCLLTLSSLLKSCRCLGSQILIKWRDSAGRRVVEAEVSCSTQNRFSINCTVTVVLFFKVFTGVEV